MIKRSNGKVLQLILKARYVRKTFAVINNFYAFKILIGRLSYVAYIHVDHV